ncbi:hypothetical protein TNCV_4986211 [Trichonephila clavipes]|nr:hypothetical protein TNCV_4986211 [Trichonephila clavipes]
MLEREETDSRSIDSSDRFRATAERRNVVNHQTRLWQRFQRTGDVTRQPVSGRPRVTTPSQDRYLCRTHNLLQVPIAELAERWTELPQVSDESRSFFRVHTGYFSNIPKCIKAEFIASWGCSQSSVVSSSQR